MDTKIQDLNISPTVKSALLSTGFTKISDLVGHNFITLAKIFPKNCLVEPIITELNPLGYLLPPENEISVYDIPMSSRLQNTSYKEQCDVLVTAIFDSQRRNPTVSESWR